MTANNKNSCVFHNKELKLTHDCSIRVFVHMQHYYNATIKIRNLVVQNEIYSWNAINNQYNNMSEVNMIHAAQPQPNKEPWREQNTNDTM